MTGDRVVFDCNVFFQALTSPQGPARRLFETVAQGGLTLVLSERTIAEFCDVAQRPALMRKYGLNPDRIATFVGEMRTWSTLIADISEQFFSPRDPSDAHYVNLALAANARLIVSRDHDLLSLRDQSTKEGQDFVARFPELRILTPPELLAIIDGGGA